MTADGSSHRPRKLDITLRLPAVEALFEPPRVTPLSPSFHVYSYTSGLEYIADRLYADRRLQTVDATFLLPGDRLSSTNVDAVRAAVGRFTDAKIEAARIELQASLLRGRRALLVGLVAVVALLSAARLVDALGANWVAETVALGLQIAAWVALWFPIEKMSWETWTHRNDRRIYERIGGMQFTVAADDGNQ